MLKKTIKYEDFNGVTVEEDFYFNLNKAEIIELQSSTKGGFYESLEKIAKSQDVVSGMKIFKNMILGTVGKKSEDGRRFIKSKEISDEFEQSPAYEILFMELVTNPDMAKEFMEGVLPTLTPEQKAEVDKQLAKMKQE